MYSIHCKTVTKDSVKLKMEFTIIMRYFFFERRLLGVSETEKTVDRVSIMELEKILLQQQFAVSRNPWLLNHSQGVLKFIWLRRFSIEYFMRLQKKCNFQTWRFAPWKINISSRKICFSAFQQISKSRQALPLLKNMFSKAALISFVYSKKKCLRFFLCSVVEKKQNQKGWKKVQWKIRREKVPRGLRKNHKFEKRDIYEKASRSENLNIDFGDVIWIWLVNLLRCNFGIFFHLRWTLKNNTTKNGIEKINIFFE